MHGNYNIIISVLACEVVFIGALCTIYCIHQSMTIRLLANRFSRMQIFSGSTAITRMRGELGLKRADATSAANSIAKTVSEAISVTFDRGLGTKGIKGGILLNIQPRDYQNVLNISIIFIKLLIHCRVLYNVFSVNSTN